MFWRFHWQIGTGVVIGLAAAAVILATFSERRVPIVASGQMISECDGRLRKLVIQYEGAPGQAVLGVYESFLHQVGPDVTVYAVCPHRAAYDQLCSAVGKVACRIEPVLVAHPMTSWSRDRWVALSGPAGGGPPVLLYPKGEAQAPLWPQRAGDHRIAGDLAAALSPHLAARQSELYFDGGDLLADDRNVFLMPRLLGRNVQVTVSDASGLLQAMGAELKKNVILLSDAPDHHAGMFMMAAGEGRMLVADPSLAAKFVPPQYALSAPAPGGSAARAEPQSRPANWEFMNLPGGVDFSAQTQRRFDAVADQCERAGYKVTRIPVVPAGNGRAFLTYVNVIIDQQAGKRVVYMPVYRGVDPLNAAAEEVWRGLGYEVKTVDCTGVYLYSGCLHCLVNVIERA